MKCICGSGVNEEITELRKEIELWAADWQTHNDRVAALRKLWSVSIKNNTGLKAQITWLEDVLLEVRTLASKSFSPSSRPLLQAKSQPDHE